MTREPGKRAGGGLLVSVVTPSYNQGAFIRETIESVLNQDYPDVEYIVVDGGSTDSTVEILKGYGGRIRWVSERDSGQTDAIIKGFKMAGGGVLAWLNSDDVYLPGAVSRAVEAFGKDPEAGAVYGRSLYIDSGGKTVGEYPTGEFDLTRLASFNFLSQPSVFFRRASYEAAGGLDKSLSYAMDYDLWIRLAMRYRFVYIPEALSAYRLHGESKTVSGAHALGNAEEALSIAIRRFGWAPPNRVYARCHALLRSKLPGAMKGAGFLLIPVASVYALLSYIRLNRGVRAGDVKALSVENIRKVLSGWRGF